MKRAWLSLVALLAGCAENSPRPSVVLPPRWINLPPTATVQPARGDVALWERFGCAELQTLLAAAEQHSLENASAGAREAQAEALARVAEVPLYPSIGAEIALTAQSANSKSLGSISGGFLDVGLVAAYEIDLWHVNGKRAAAADSRSRASRFERASTKLDVSVGVAQTYFEILSLRERLARARSNFASTERVLAIVEARERTGTALAREVAQQRALLASETAILEQISQAEAVALVSLAVASGKQELDVSVQAESLDVVADPAIVLADVDVPARLLSRRPDVARAEAELVATQADLAAARAAILPKLRLTASLALQSVFFTEYSSDPGIVYNGILGLSQPIIDGGAWRAERDAAIAKRTQAEADYRRAVLTAVGEVEQSLRSLAGLQKQCDQQQIVMAEARRAFNLLEIEYQAGAEDLLSVLDAQRVLFRAEDDYGQLRLAKLRAAVSLVKALGGGWTSRAH